VTNKGQVENRKGGVELREMAGFKKQIVWQRAYELTIRIYRLTNSFPKSESYGLRLQLRRGTASIPVNIAEGYERGHRKEYLQFLNIARGFLGELGTFISLAKDLGYVNSKEYETINNLRVEVGKSSRGLTRFLSGPSPLVT
jgi:four helix bundle protein